MWLQADMTLKFSQSYYLQNPTNSNMIGGTRNKTYLDMIRKEKDPGIISFAASMTSYWFIY